MTLHVFKYKYKYILDSYTAWSYKEWIVSTRLLCTFIRMMVICLRPQDYSIAAILLLVETKTAAQVKLDCSSI